MESRKLLAYKRSGTSTNDEPKTETAPNQVTEKIVEQPPRVFTMPLQLELAGNRFSPLHEW